MNENEMKELNRHLIDKIDEAILHDDPSAIKKLNLIEEQIIDFMYQVQGPRANH